MRKIDMYDSALKFYGLLMKYKKVSKVNYKEFSNIIIKLAKKDLDIIDIDVSYGKFNKNLGGFKDDLNICLNSSNYSTFSIHKFINSIFHEFRHLYQAEHRTYKTFGKSSGNLLHANYFDVFAYYYINEENFGVSPFELYLISNEEQDARQYANKMTLEFLEMLKDCALNDKNNFFISVLIDLQIHLANKAYDKEYYNIKLAEKNLRGYLPVIATNAFYFLKNELKESTKFYDHNMMEAKTKTEIFSKIKLVTDFYYDEKIENLIHNHAFKEKDPFILSCAVNSIFAKVDENTLYNCVDMFINNGNQIHEIKKYLNNWEPKIIVNMYNQLINNDIKTIDNKD